MQMLCTVPAAFLLIVLSLLAAAGDEGCVQITVGPPDEEQQQDPTEEIPASMVQIRFGNFSEETAVDVQFYAATVALEDPAVGLFTEEYRVTQDIGFAGTGLLEPQSQDDILLDCGEVLILGTAGGEFRDLETGQQVAVGTRRIAILGAQFDCGDRITFAFRDEDGLFETDMDID